MWQAIKEDLNDLVRPAAAEDNASVGVDAAEATSLDEERSCDGSNSDVDGDDENRPVTNEEDGDNILDQSNDTYGDGSYENDDGEDSIREEGHGLLYKMGLFGNDEEVEITPEMEAARRCELEATFTEPLLIAGDDAAAGNDVEENIDGENGGSDEEASIDVEAMEREEIQQFLESFDVQSHTEEISQLLSAEEEVNDATPTPLLEYFHSLVPQTVSYRDFWARYYYRCDPHRIARQWDLEEKMEELNIIRRRERREKALREVSVAAVSIGRSAASLLKGGLSGAVEAIGVAGEAVEEAAAELRLHQSKGRPPFVMAAVEDDDDSYYEEEDDDEEELEWEDEEEGEDQEGPLDDSGLTSDFADSEDSISEDEEVHFLDVSLDEEGQGPTVPHTPLKLESLDVVRLRRSLMHAEEERNHMLQMVEERNAEMYKLQSALERQQQCPSSDSVGDIAGDSKGEVNVLQREVEWLKHLVAAKGDDSTQKDASMMALRSTMDNMKADIQRRQYEANIQNLQLEIQQSRENMTASKADKYAHLQGELSQLKEQLDNIRNDTQETNNRVSECQVQLRELRDRERTQADEQAIRLEQAVAQARAPLETSSGSTMSSGVKVPEDGWD